MDLSIVIVNWNSVAYLRKCLQSIFVSRPALTFEVIVVDNASFDGSARLIEEEFPNVTFLQSGINLGFAKANNLGAAHAKGRILLFLNPDTQLVGPALEQMVTALDTHPRAGIVGCRLLNSDGSLQTSCVQAFPTIFNELLNSECLRQWFPRLRIWGTGAFFSASADPVAVESVSGACLMIRRDVFDKVDQFSGNFFMYVEDRDLCCKVAVAGMAVLYVPEASVVHYGGTSSGTRTESNFSSVLRCESLYRYMRLRHGYPHAALYRLSVAAAATVRLALLLPLLVFGRSEATLRSRKWRQLLRWSVGFEPWATRAGISPPDAPQGPCVQSDC